MAADAIESLRTAEAGAAREKAAVGYSFVAFEESLQLCCSVLSLIEPAGAAAAAAGDGGSRLDRWHAVAAGAACLADSLGRAQLCVTSKVRGPALRQAEDVLQRALSTSLTSQLCCCFAEAAAAEAAAAGGSAGNSGSSSGAGAAAGALLGALAALVHVPAARTNAGCVADHFPLAQMLAAKITDAPDQGLDSDANLLEVSSKAHTRGTGVAWRLRPALTASTPGKKCGV